MTEKNLVETDVLIIGTGPTGLSMAALLAREGIDCITINKYGSTARNPRAHITNQRCMEVFRDLDIEDQMINVGTPKELMGEHVFCRSLAGEEIARLEAWGNNPTSYADHEYASPSRLCDIPQDRMEPILLDTAQKLDAKVRMYTEYVSHVQDEDFVITTVRDRLRGDEYQIRSKYMIGADGARSQVAEDLGLPFEGKMGLSGGFNIVFQADLSKYVEHRPGVIYMMFQEEGAGIGGSPVGSLRMAETWNRWVAYWGYDISQGEPEITEQDARDVIDRLVGEKLDDVKIESYLLWTVNDMHALENHKGRVFCAGDAVHRHPPTNGLGTNTCVQDVMNLAWKMAMVIKGEAGPDLLTSYQEERVPVARQIVKRANKSMDEIIYTLGALGLNPNMSKEEVAAQFEKRKDDTPEGEEMRHALLHGFGVHQYDFDCHGVEVNQRYTSAAIVTDGTPDPGFEKDEELYYQASSRPGAHLPHAWLVNKRTQKRVSTLDLCGKGKFTLLTGISGEKRWAAAIEAVKAALGVDIKLEVIGMGRAYEDSYGYYAKVREVEESGALLVRPDFFVGYRAPIGTDTISEELVSAMTKILAKG
ncbi:MAG: 2,4-dichlorophenol 6-monooxygenase [Kordiimonas sp.]|nr:2,4-dichlorophenol 6-monooxygenase [Kordiimonas sp.]